MTKKRFVTTVFLTCFVSACALSACNTTPAPHVHSFGDWAEVTAPTCTEAGTEERSCDCGEKEVRQADALGHACGDYVKTEEEHYKKCSRCGEETDRGAHVFDKENTCTTCGYKLIFTDNLAYSEIKDGEEVVAYSVAGFAEGVMPTAEITVPAYHDGKPVTAIGYAAFYAEADNPNTEIKSVTLPSTVTELGDYAFNHCTALEKINLQNVRKYGSCAFWDTALKSVELSGNPVTLADYVFYGIPTLEKIIIDTELTVGDYAFYSNAALKTVEFGKNAKGNFGGGVYFGSDALEKITVDSNDVVLGGSIKAEDGTVDVVFGDNVTAIQDNEINDYAVKSITIGKNVKTIGKQAFRDCMNITELVLPEGLTEIGDYAFWNCGLVNVTIPKSLKTVGDYSFSKSLKKVYYNGSAADWAKITFVDSGVSSPIHNEAVLYVNGEACDTLDLRGAEKVNAAAFYGAKYTKIILGEELKELGHQCFAHMPASGTIFNPAQREASNKLEELVVLCKKLDLGTSETTYFLNTFNADTVVYYYGTAEEMDENVTIGDRHRFVFDNKVLTHSFYSKTQPAEAGNFWHFDENGKVVKW